MPEQPQSLESQLKMARPRRHEVKRVPLTPEEKEFLGKIMDKAIAAEKAGELVKALEYYQEYRIELLKIKEIKEKLPKKMTEQEKLEAAKEALFPKSLTKSFEEMVTSAKAIVDADSEQAFLADSNGDLVAILKKDKTILPKIIGFKIDNHIKNTMGFHDLFTTEDRLLIGKLGAYYYVFDQNFKLLAKPEMEIAKIGEDIFIPKTTIKGMAVKHSPIPAKLNDINEHLQDTFIQKADGLYWKEVNK